MKKPLVLITNKQDEIPDCPDHLNDTARHIWHTRAPRLAELGLLTKIDRAAFSMLCTFTARYFQARELEESTSEKEARAWKKIKNSSLKMARTLAAEFFQTDEFEELLRQGRPFTSKEST